jgi:misacylated tRNA(Ala) deacylase
MSEPTIALYYDDYKQEMDARLVEVRPEGLVLDRTVFYPRGGNQDCDQGTLAGDMSLHVEEVLKADDGAITHRTTDAAPAGWAPGTALHGTLDWERRITLMRLHTGQHLISRWFLDHGGNGTTRVDITAAGCVIELERTITLEEALACQAELNALIAAGRPVRRIDTDGYLEIEVEGYDRQPCGGTHVHDVAEVERIAFTRVKGNRLELRCGPQAEQVERQMAAAVLGLQGELETDLTSFAERVRHLLGEYRTQRAALFALREEAAAARIARALAAPQVVTTADGGTANLYAIDLELLESKQLPRLLKPAQGAGRVFCCLCAGRNLAVISGSPALPAQALVNALKARHGLSGGGSAAFAQCGPLPADVSLDMVLTIAGALCGRPDYAGGASSG